MPVSAKDRLPTSRGAAAPRSGVVTQRRYGWRHLAAVPAEASRHAATLEKLHLHDNDLVALPLALGDFPRLRVLTLSRNRALGDAMWPAVIRLATTLEVLEASDASIESVPAAAGRLANLASLAPRPSGDASSVGIRFTHVRRTAPSVPKPAKISRHGVRAAER